MHKWNSKFAQLTQGEITGIARSTSFGLCVFAFVNSKQHRLPFAAQGKKPVLLEIARKRYWNSCELSLLKGLPVPAASP
jgi:hypothetical protein